MVDREREQRRFDGLGACCRQLSNRISDAKGVSRSRFKVESENRRWLPYPDRYFGLDKVPVIGIIEKSDNLVLRMLGLGEEVVLVFDPYKFGPMMGSNSDEIGMEGDIEVSQKLEGVFKKGVVPFIRQFIEKYYQMFNNEEYPEFFRRGEAYNFNEILIGKELMLKGPLYSDLSHSLQG